MILADLFMLHDDETIAIINTKRGVHTDGKGHDWVLQQADSSNAVRHHGKVLQIETHGHSAVVSFGNSIPELSQFDVYNAGRWHGRYTVRRAHVYDQQFELVAALFVRDELDQKDLLEQWVKYHLQIGVEHILVYVNSPKAMDEMYMQSLQDRFPEYVTFIPFWFNHWVYLGDQQAQNMHALYTAKGSAKWLLSSDIDEFVDCQQPLDLLNILRNASSETHAIQLTSFTVSADGRLSDKPMYGTVFKGKVILNTKTCTGHSVHMVTDVVGHHPSLKDRVAGHHQHVPTHICWLTHFHRTLDKWMLYDKSIVARK